VHLLVRGVVHEHEVVALGVEVLISRSSTSAPGSFSPDLKVRSSTLPADHVLHLDHGGRRALAGLAEVYLTTT
jgi:hypothetical protein